MPNGLKFSNPQDCHSYFECRNGQRLEFTCSANESFDAERSQCGISSTVNCGNRRSLNNQAQQNMASFTQL